MGANFPKISNFNMMPLKYSRNEYNVRMDELQSVYVEILEPLAYKFNHLVVNLSYLRWFIIDVTKTIFVVVVNGI